MQSFRLTRAREICPATGEYLGQALARFAEAEKARLANPASASWLPDILYLAAEAYEQGASVSIGHNRSACYEERAQQLRNEAAALEVEAKRQHDEALTARLMVACQHGYEGLDGKRYAFDEREAFLIGRHFADQGLEIPERILKVYTPRPLSRDSERDHMVVDGVKFVVDYPNGRVDDAIVVQL